MPPLAVYRFELYQINVSQDVGGDCAIMLLINTAMKVSGKSRVEWAALIDGGDGTGCTRFLIKTMQGLEEKYAFEGGDKVYSVGAFKFDVVSISHWDQVCPSICHGRTKVDKKIGSLGVSSSSVSLVQLSTSV